MDVSLANIWKCWYTWKQGKKRTREIDNFTYHLEEHLLNLYSVIKNQTYVHDKYQIFTISDTKTRTISVASIRDRILHRLLYDYLVTIFDKTFVYDAWSCRSGKGLHKCVERTYLLIRKYNHGWVWRADIAKFFDNIDHEVLKSAVFRKVSNPTAQFLIRNVIDSFSTDIGKGIPIGNLTSQIFANIYLNELDRFISHTIRPLGMVRYGDDFLVFGENEALVSAWRVSIKNFLNETLKVELHKENDIIVPTQKGVHYLGLIITPYEKRLRKRIVRRIKTRLSIFNVSSYRSLSKTYKSDSMLQWIDWQIACQLSSLYE